MKVKDIIDLIISDYTIIYNGKLIDIYNICNLPPQKFDDMEIKNISVWNDIIEIEI